ncbi:MAG: hypothetical protein IKP14_11280 [Clostridiales bacterium]|nr:hypothetical protein [Clostridiales bacterium]
MAARARVDEVSFVHGLYDIAEGEFKGIHKGRPNAEDIAAAVEFVKQYKV